MKRHDMVYVLAGIIIGFMAVLPVVSIGIALIGYLKMYILILPVIALSLTVFGLIQFTVSRKKFQKLKNFYLMAAVVSLGVMIIPTKLALDLTQGFLGKIVSAFKNSIGTVLAAVFIYSVIAIGILIFGLIFSAITRPKTKYIQYITDEVQKIAKDGNNIRIEEKGCDELAILSRSINRMNEDLQENRLKQLAAEKQKNELIANVSHDLRSPLTSIIGYVQLLKECGANDTEKFNEYIEVTDRRLQGLNKLINELFELTKMDSPSFSLNREQGDITAFIKQFVYEMTALLSSKKLKLVSKLSDNEFIAHADFERLARVMQNLFANVLEYAVSNTDVILESTIIDNHISILLSNSFSGNAEIDTETIFDRFYRSDTARSDTGNAGLGLAIAKRIIVLHGGNIAAKVDGNTITITVTLYK
jgi:signal transduction histidine kinase